MNSEEKNKRYTVVDKRKAGMGEGLESGDMGQEEKSAPRDAQTAPTAEAPAGAAARGPAGAPAETPPQQDGDDDDLGPVDPLSLDPVSLTLTMLREQAMIGMRLLAHPKMADRPINVEAATEAARLFQKTLKKFGGDAPEEEEIEDIPDASIVETVMFLINLLRSQTFIHMGLMANPGNNLIAKRLDMAKKCIDLFAFLIEEIKGRLDPAYVRELEGALADLRVNYVQQLGG